MIVLLIAAHLIFTFLVTPHGHFTDSVYYHSEVVSLIQNHSFEIMSGEMLYPETLKYSQIHSHEGTLYSQYPSIFSLISLPFVFLFGISGLFIVNALSLIGVVYVQSRLIRHISRDTAVSAIAFFILIFGSYFWYYSQAIWPHMFSIFVTFSAAYYAIIGKDNAKQPYYYFLTSGFLLGIAIGTRLDSVFALPAIGILCLFHRYYIRNALFFVLGLLPPMIVLCLINDIKFGSYLPFSYGTRDGNTNITQYAYIVCLLVSTHILFFLYKYTSENIPRKLRISLITILWTIIACIGAFLLVPLLKGIGVILLDMAWLDPHILENGMFRSPEGDVLYMHTYKKAFIQSFPLFYMSLLPLFFKQFRSNISAFHLYWLYLIPFSYFLVFCTLQWHGGMSLDMRYLLPTLPFLSITATLVLRHYSKHIKVKKNSLFLPMLIMFIYGVLLLIVCAFLHSESIRRFVYLDFSHVAGIILCMVAIIYRNQSHTFLSSKLLLFFVLFLIVWGGILSAFDYFSINARRTITYESELEKTLKYIKPNSLVISSYGRPTYFIGKVPNVKVTYLRLSTQSDTEKLQKALHILRKPPAHSPLGQHIRSYITEEFNVTLDDSNLLQILPATLQHKYFHQYGQYIDLFLIGIVNDIKETNKGLLRGFDPIDSYREYLATKSDIADDKLYIMPENLDAIFHFLENNKDHTVYFLAEAASAHYLAEDIQAKLSRETLPFTLDLIYLSENVTLYQFKSTNDYNLE